MTHSGDEKADRHRAAVERGERIRATLRKSLKRGGPKTAAELYPDVGDKGVSLSEVVFQLERLADEGLVAGERGKTYAAL